MEPDFWHERWERREIGFHEGEANAALVAHLDALGLAQGARILVPLCGKTRDIAWLLARGHRIAGVELSPLAIGELFAELGRTPTITADGPIAHHHADNLDIWVGDIFDLTPERLGTVDAIYDRAALVALPPTLRSRYTAHLMALTQSAPQLLMTYEYDQQSYDGPPFSVREVELREHYEGAYHLRLLARQPVEGGLKGQTPASAATWLLQGRQS
jgi:thiopurine S-methyltransferase